MTIGKILNILFTVAVWTTIIVVVYGIVIEDKEVSNSELASKIDSLHTVQMKKLNKLDSMIVKYNVNVEIGLLDFMSSEAISLMENADE